MTRIIAPSLLSADFGNLARDIEMLNGSAARWIHLDVMDGVFVPNISFGFPVIKAIRKATTKTLDAHLMIIEPERYIERFAKAGCDNITIHGEAVEDLSKAIDMIHNAGAKAGVSVKPATGVESVFPYLDKLDQVLIMSVEPGFGGQAFMPESLDKVRALRAEIDRRGLETLIEIDGGISPYNSEAAFGAGCNVLVVGSAVFKDKNPADAIKRMLEGQETVSK